MQLTASAHFPHRLVAGFAHAHGNVTLKFPLQAFANLTARDIFTFLAGQRRRVDHKGHRKCRLIDLEHRKRFGMLDIGNRRADIQIINAVDKKNVARLCIINNFAIQTLKLQDLSDFDLSGRAPRAVH